MELIQESRGNTNSITSKHVIFGGTHILRARRPHGSEDVEAIATALVLRTGFDTTKGNLVRSMLFPRPSGFKFYSDSFRYIRIMAVIALIGVVASILKLRRFEVRFITFS